MKHVGGIWWPDATTERQMAYAHRSVQWVEWSIEHCGQRRTAVQAGGNVGLWPRRLAQSFSWVVTVEPDAIMWECLIKNLPRNVTAMNRALGDRSGHCGIKHRSLGAHRVVDGDDVRIIRLDDVGWWQSPPLCMGNGDGLPDPTVDLIVLDLEGYELHALKGAQGIIERWSPIIQVEVRGDEEKYGYTESDVQEFLGALGYTEVSRQPGPDAVFARQ